MKNIFLLLLIIFGSFGKIYSEKRLKIELDTTSSDTTFLNQVFDLFGEENNDIIDAQYSKRKQVDALLNSILEKPGKLQFSGVATATFQSELKNKNSYHGVGAFDIFAFTSFGEYALLFFDFQAIGGNGPDVLIPNISGLNNNAGSTVSADGIDRLTVLEAWTEFKAIRDIFSVSFGKIDLTNYFDNNLHANDETSQFITGVFVNNPVLPITFNSPGIRFRTTFLGKIYIQYGLVMADKFDSNIMVNHFKILETGFKLFPESGWEANFRIFGFEHPFAGNSQGFGISFDQLIANHFNIFGRYGKNEPALAEWHGIEKAWSGGIGFKQMLFQNEYKVGIAYAETYPFNQELPERIVEFYFNTQINKWVFVSPHFQWLNQNNTGREDYYILGMRLNFSY